jgi:hypothetical protein
MDKLIAFIGNILGALGVLVIFGSCFLIGSSLMWVVMGWGAALWMISSVTVLPGWAFKQASLPRSVWLLIGFIGVIPLLGFVSLVSWLVFNRPVVRAWAVGDPASYNAHNGMIAAIRRGSANYQAQQPVWQTSSSTGGGGTCAVCGGRGWHYSDGGGNQMPCYACGGSGWR